MEPTPDLDLERSSHPGPVPPRHGWLSAAVGLLHRAGERLVLWLHRQADRLDLIPNEFGDDKPVDREDAGAVAREWLRQAKLWAGYNPEEMLAIKAGALALGIALLLLVVLVRAIR